MHKSSNSPYSTVGAREHIQETWNLWSWENVCKVLHPLPGGKFKTWLLNARRLPAYCICSTYYVHLFDMEVVQLPFPYILSIISWHGLTNRGMKESQVHLVDRWQCFAELRGITKSQFFWFLNLVSTQMKFLQSHLLPISKFDLNADKHSDYSSGFHLNLLSCLNRRHYCI